MDAITPTLPLLTPHKLGQFHLSHRVVLAPLTRMRSYNNVPQPPAILYYSQRTSNGVLLIAEATGVSDTAQGYPHTLSGPKSKLKHGNQLLMLFMPREVSSFFKSGTVEEFGIAASFQPNGQDPISSTDKPITANIGGMEFTPPRRLSTEEIPQLVNDFRVAASNALEPGFDGVEVHGAHGYLLEQVLKDEVNDRIENSCHFQWFGMHKAIFSEGLAWVS